MSQPRAAALQGIDKMRANLALGLAQGLFVPPPRPADGWLAQLGTTIEEADPVLAANAMSASAMWAANAATVSPAPDTADGSCHLTVANLRTMPHRSHEWPATLAQLRLAFAGRGTSRSMIPVPPAFGDEGAANHMRFAAAHGAAGRRSLRLRRQRRRLPGPPASRSVARRSPGCTGSIPQRTLFVEQSEEAIAAGAFHNDVVAVANERVLFAHEQAFADRDGFLDQFERADARASKSSRCRTPRCRSPTRSDPICSTRSWSPRRTAR